MSMDSVELEDYVRGRNRLYAGCCMSVCMSVSSALQGGQWCRSLERLI